MKNLQVEMQTPGPSFRLRYAIPAAWQMTSGLCQADPSAPCITNHPLLMVQPPRTEGGD